MLRAALEAEQKASAKERVGHDSAEQALATQAKEIKALQVALAESKGLVEQEKASGLAHSKVWSANSCCCCDCCSVFIGCYGQEIKMLKAAVADAKKSAATEKAMLSSERRVAEQALDAARATAEQHAARADAAKAELAAAKQEDSSMSQEMAMLKTELRAELDVARTQLAAAQEEDSLVLQKMETMKAELAGVRKQAQEQQMVLDKELAEMKIELSACQVREQLKMTTETMCNGGCSDIMLGR